MPLGKHRAYFDQVFDFNRERVSREGYCGLSFREIGERVGRNQATVMWICHRWMQEETTDRRGQSHLPH
ncbi:transposable element Tcb1 transposase [Trichonephila clavipes]|nr:transposable element Tcb1 transposase [Trichonephila clavipes]